MTIAAGNHVAACSSDGNGVTTTGISTVGAKGIYLGVTYDNGTTPVISDSKSNTWTPRTAVNNVADGISCRIYYCENPTTDAAHTFSASAVGSEPGIGVLAVTGVLTASSYDGVENGATAHAATTLQTGSATPDEDNCILIAFCGCSHQITSIGSSFTLLDNPNPPGTSWGPAMAYKIQTTAGAENPAFGFASSNAVAAIAVFKSDPTPPATNRPVRMAGAWGGFAGPNGGFA